MFSTLAQNTAIKTTESVAKVFGRMDAIASKDLLGNLQDLHVVLAGVFVAGGLACILQGYRIYKVVVIVIALITGLSLGSSLGTYVEADMIVAACLGILLAVVAWPLMKYAVAIAGGIAGAFIGANIWSVLASNPGKYMDINVPAGTHWAGALIGLILFGVLSFILFEISVLIFTSVSGAVLVTLGLIALLLNWPLSQDATARALQNNPMVVMIIMVVPTVIGLVLQQQWGGVKALKQKPAGAGAPMPKPAPK